MSLPQRHRDTERKEKEGRRTTRSTLPLWLCVSVAELICLIASAAAHDLFLKFDSYFLQPNAKTTVRLMNGYFNRSENAVERDRMLDVSVVTPSGDRINPPASDWRDEKDSASLSLQTGGGKWFVKFIQMTKLNEANLDYESKWASLTFEIR